MINVINRLAAKVVSNEADQQKLHKYQQMMGHDGWVVHQEYLLTVRGLMAENMLSEQFSALSASEKDAIQRAYAMVDRMIIFLLDPLVKARSMAAIQAHNKKQEATVMGATGKRIK